MVNRFMKLRRFFVTGLVVTTPLIITIYIIWYLFNFLDGTLRPIQKRFLGDYIPGLSLIITLLLITFVGAFATYTLGERLLQSFEKWLLKIPIVKSIYAPMKEASSAFLMQRPSDFKMVVLVEFPRKNMYALGFTTTSTIKEIQEKTKEKVINVYIPTTPIPTSGYLTLIPEKDVIPLDISVEDALKLIISGGFSGNMYIRDEVK